VVAGQSCAHGDWDGVCEHGQNSSMVPKKQVPEGTAPGNGDVGREGGREMLIEMLLQGRPGNLPDMPCRADSFPEQHTSCLLSLPTKPLDHRF